MKKFLSIIMCAILILLSGCTQPIKGGYVVGKHYQEARTETRYNVVLHINEVVHHPARWIVYVADSTHVEALNVERSTFESVSVGQYVAITNRVWRASGE